VARSSKFIAKAHRKKIITANKPVKSLKAAAQTNRDSKQEYRHEHEKETFGSCDCFMTATTRVPSIMRPLFEGKVQSTTVSK